MRLGFSVQVTATFEREFRKLLKRPSRSTTYPGRVITALQPRPLQPQSLASNQAPHRGCSWRWPISDQIFPWSVHLWHRKSRRLSQTLQLASRGHVQVRFCTKDEVLNATSDVTSRRGLKKAGTGQIFAASLMAVMLLAATFARGEEKYWIAHQASLIVLGTLRPNPTFPWFDGWHITGTIDVDEVLFGPRPPAHIDYRSVCPYALCGDWRALPSVLAFLRAKECGAYGPSMEDHGNHQ